MIFSAIVNFFKAIVDGFANLCAFLLLRLGLWLPASFCIVFVLICTIGAVPFEDGTVIIFVVGVVSSTALGGALASRLNKRKKPQVALGSSMQYVADVKLRDDFKTSDKLQKIQDVPIYGITKPLNNENQNRGQAEYLKTNDLNYSDRDGQQGNENEAKSIRERAEAEQSPRQSSYKSTMEKLNSRPYKYDDFSDLRRKYLNEQDGEPPSSSFAKERERLSENTREARQQSIREPRQQSIREPRQQNVRREEPMVFATRKDPNVLIYEYSDRLDFYKRTKNGVEFLETVYKD